MQCVHVLVTQIAVDLKILSVHPAALVGVAMANIVTIIVALLVVLYQFIQPVVITT
jgi:hypothetical protein